MRFQNKNKKKRGHYFKRRKDEVVKGIAVSIVWKKKRRLVGNDEFVSFRLDFYLVVCGIKHNIVGKIIVLKKLGMILFTSLLDLS